MVMVFKSGQMEQNMKEIGKIIRPMDKVFSGMSTETNMRDHGKEIKLMVSENIHTVTVLLTKVIGETIYNMDTVLNSGTTIQNIK